jgi:hypothetical protein
LCAGFAGTLGRIALDCNLYLARPEALARNLDTAHFVAVRLA